MKKELDIAAVIEPHAVVHPWSFQPAIVGSFDARPRFLPP